eukprot:scaffold70693_cov58-Phaeocystis_antarctica.AAC.1
MAILLRRSIRSFWAPQAASDSIRRPEPPAEEAAVKDRHVHGSGGRHQVATLLSFSPLTTLIAAILSAHHGSDDFQSNDCATGGANHIRSSLMMVLEDTASVWTTKWSSSGPPEDREAGCRVYPGLSARSHEGG